MYDMEIILKGPPGKKKNNIHTSHRWEQWSTTEKEANEDGDSPRLWTPSGSRAPGLPRQPVPHSGTALGA